MLKISFKTYKHSKFASNKSVWGSTYRTQAPRPGREQIDPSPMTTTIRKLGRIENNIHRYKYIYQNIYNYWIYWNKNKNGYNTNDRRIMQVWNKVTVLTREGLLLLQLWSAYWWLGSCSKALVSWQHLVCNKRPIPTMWGTTWKFVHWLADSTRSCDSQTTQFNDPFNLQNGYQEYLLVYKVLNRWFCFT